MSALAPLAVSRAASRLPAFGGATATGSPAVAEVLVLISAGALATALSVVFKVRLGIPGHHIVLVAPALALGLALVPRRLGGCVMSASAAATGLAVGVGLGAGSFTSTLLLGPALDLALAQLERPGRPPRRFAVHAAFIAAGLGANLVALAVRTSGKLFAPGVFGGGRPFEAWWPQAIVTYALCGVLAGLAASAMCFRGQPAPPK